MIQKCVLLGGLFCLAWIDWKTREIPVWILAALGGGGLLLCRADGGLWWETAMGGILVGGVLLLGAVITRQSIGIGDGLLFCVTGIYLGLWQNLLLLFLSSVCAAAAALILLIKKKYTRKEQIPFAPFVLTAEVLMQVLVK